MLAALQIAAAAESVGNSTAVTAVAVALAAAAAAVLTASSTRAAAVCECSTKVNAFRESPHDTPAVRFAYVNALCFSSSSSSS
jgi:hypothetical protein